MKLTTALGLIFRPMELEDSGVIVITDSSLGNIAKTGSALGTTADEVYSQSAYMVILAEASLLRGGEGGFSHLDAPSHRLPRELVGAPTLSCRALRKDSTVGSSPAARWLPLGLPMENRYFDSIMALIPLRVVVHAKNVFDKCNSETTFGNQKSLAFAVSLDEICPQAAIDKPEWTATENMLVDGGTKLMDTRHLRDAFTRGRWSIKFHTDFFKGKSKKTKVKDAPSPAELQPLSESHPIFPFLHQLSDGDTAIQ